VNSVLTSGASAATPPGRLRNNWRWPDHDRRRLHNHHYQSSANQGFRWWEIDLTYYVLRLFALLGLIWDLRRPPREVVLGDSPGPEAKKPTV
jgi:hypothetical protein